MLLVMLVDIADVIEQFTQQSETEEKKLNKIF
jgi:hypothetical protein